MESIQTSVAVLTLIEKNIILFQVNPHSDFGLKEMLEVREGNSILNQGNPYCVLMEAGEFSSFSKEAREASASDEHIKNRLALAIIQSNFAMKFLMKFYMRINKPKGLTRTFNSKSEALEWLRLIRDIHSSKEKKKNKLSQNKGLHKVD